MNPESPRCLVMLRALLSLLRAQYWMYQNAHWEVKGDASYGSHLLFQRIYKGDDDNEGEDDDGIQGEVDALAEKMVGLIGIEAVDSCSLIAMVQGWLHRWSRVDCLHKRSLMSEQDAQAVMRKTYDVLKADDKLTLGMDDFLMSLASEHETNMYLIQQILRGRDQQASFQASWEMWGKEFPTGEARPGKQRQVIERALRIAALEDQWKKGAPLGGWSAEMTPLEKTWGGFSSFTPIRRGEEGEDEDSLLEDNDDLMAMWFKTDNDEGYFHTAPQWRQLQDYAESGEQPELDEEPFSGWTLSE